MIVQKIANSGKDEYYTPIYAIEPIEKYLPRCSTIWCPFDTRESLFVKYFTDKGHRVIHSHILNGTDFFNCTPPKCDYIISNPPYSKKTEVFERLFDLGVPFAMLVGCVGLFEAKRFRIFQDKEFEIMLFNKRVCYFDDYAEETAKINPPFSSWYVCHNVLPKKIVFEEISKTMKRE